MAKSEERKLNENEFILSRVKIWPMELKFI